MNAIKLKIRVLIAAIIDVSYATLSVIIGFICRATQGNTEGWSTHIYVAIVGGLLSIILVDKILEKLDERED